MDSSYEASCVQTLAIYGVAARQLITEAPCVHHVTANNWRLVNRHSTSAIQIPSTPTTPTIIPNS